MKVVVAYTKTVVEEIEIEVNDKFKVMETGCNHLSFNEIGRLKDELTIEVSKNIIASDDEYIKLQSARSFENDEMLWEW